MKRLNDNNKQINATFTFANFTRLVFIKKMIFKIAKNTERNTIEAITNRPSIQVVIAVTAKKIEPNVDMNKVKIADLL